MTKENKSTKGLKNPGLIVGLVFLAIIIIVGALFYLNYNDNKDYDDSVYTPIPVKESDIVPQPRENIIDIYNNNKETFDKVINFFANSNANYTVSVVSKNGTRTADIPAEIKDQEIRSLIEKVIIDFNFNSIFTTFQKSPDDMSVWLLYDGKEGLYQRGLTFFKSLDLKQQNFNTAGNSIWDYQELAPKTFFYYNHFDKVQHEDKFRQVAWDALTKEQKDTVTTTKDKAVVLIKPTRDNKTGTVLQAISLTYKTNKSGYGNDIIVYIDGKTKKVIKTTTVGEEMIGSLGF